MLKRVFCQNHAHIYLTEERFEICAEAVQNRHEVFFVGGYQNFFDKAFDGFHIFIKQKLERQTEKINQLGVQRIHRKGIGILLGFFDRLQNFPQISAQNQRLVEFRLKIRENFRRFDIRLD